MTAPHRVLIVDDSETDRARFGPTNGWPVGTLAAGLAHEINTPIQFVSDTVHFSCEAVESVFALLAKRTDFER